MKYKLELTEREARMIAWTGLRGIKSAALLDTEKETATQLTDKLIALAAKIIAK